MADLRTRLAAYSGRLREFASQVEEESRLYPQVADALLLQCEGLRGLAASIERDLSETPQPSSGGIASANLGLIVRVQGAPAPEALEQMNARLRSVFRSDDAVIKNGPREWAVRFHGPLQALKVRCAQLDAWVSGRYTLADGSSENVSATFTIVTIPNG